MTVANGIAKKVAWCKQDAQGTPAAAGDGAQYLRRVTSVYTAANDTFKSNELNTHQQSTGLGFGVKKVTGKLSGLLSSGSYASFYASVLRKNFAATVPYASAGNTSAAVAAPNFVDAQAGYLTAGLKVGDVGRWTGFEDDGAANNGKNFLITALTAGNMSGVFLDGSAVVVSAAAADITFTVVGKKTLAPLTGHTDDYFTNEDWYSDVGKSELFYDIKVNQIDSGLPATGNATFSADAIGLSRTLGNAQVLNDAAEATDTDIMTAVNGVVFAGGVPMANVTGLTLTITGNLAQGDAVVGSDSAIDIASGTIEVSGSFTALFTDSVLSAIYDAKTTTSLIVVLTANKTDPASDFITFVLGCINLTGDAPDDGQKNIVRTYPFTAKINPAGGPALAWDKTILTVQDSAAA